MMGEQKLLSELARVKVLFQARALAAIIGAPAPDGLCVRCGAPLYPTETCACWSRNIPTENPQ